MINIRQEKPEDIAAIRAVITQAFARRNEATLVDKLREAGKATISLVATEDDRVIGHILFSPVAIESADKSSDEHSAKEASTSSKQLAALGLAPLAVLPEFQNHNIGTLLTHAGLDECRKVGCECVVVLGHPNYYPRFGFRPSVRYGLKSEYDVRDEVFMVLELCEGALNHCAGIVKYAAEFAKL
jgi:putative acetyltransferase